MRNLHILFILLTISCLFSACTKKPECSNRPRITFVNYGKYYALQPIPNTFPTLARPGDSLNLTFEFEDGDGNFGRNDTISNVFVTDSRNSTSLPFQYLFKVPVLPKEGGVDCLKGKVTVTIRSSVFTCRYSDGTIGYPPLPGEERQQIRFKLFIVDNSGFHSDTILTPPITVQCD